MKKRNAGLDLLNSLHIRGPDRIDDELDNPQWVDKFLTRWSLPPPQSARGWAKLRELRSLLRSVVDELVASHAISDDKLQRLHEFMPSMVTRTVLERDAAGGFRVIQKVEGQRHASAEIARAFVELVADDGWQRIKACSNEHCRWAFYDESRNRSRRWCDSAACGNVMKVRAFRQRKEGESEPKDRT